MLHLPRPAETPCPDCGQLVPRGMEASHACDVERLDYVVLQLRDEIAGFDYQLTAWLDSPAGRLAAWRAERGR
jgi:hypothetical protein